MVPTILVILLAIAVLIVDRKVNKSIKTQKKIEDDLVLIIDYMPDKCRTAIYRERTRRLTEG